MSDPSPEKLLELYKWLFSQIESSYLYYNTPGMKVSRNHWLNPSCREKLERAMREMEIMPEGADFPWTYCEKCGSHYPYGRYELDDRRVCGKCYTDEKYPVREE